MDCIYLESNGRKNICTASITMMEPSAYEETAYCLTEEHYRCPILLAHTIRKGHREFAERAGMMCSR